MKFKITVVAILFLAIACKKDSGSPTDYYCVADINNIQMSFSDSLKADSIFGTTPALVLEGRNDSSHKYLSFVIKPKDFVKKIITGIYNENRNHDFEIKAWYYRHFSNGIFDQYYETNNNKYNPLIITVSALTKTYVEGTISGTFGRYPYDDTVIITNGRFRATF